MKPYQTCNMIWVSKHDQTQKKRGVHCRKKSYHNYGKYLLFLWIVVFLAACAQGVPLTKDKLASIHSVCICPEIQKPPKINITFQQRKMPKSNSWSSIIRTAVQEGAQHASKAIALKRVYKMSGTSIDLIVKEQFENELQNSDIFNSVVASQGDAEFKIQIVNYGFDENFFDRKMRPKLWIKASLVTPDGIILWDQQQLCCAAEKKVHSHSLSELSNNRGLMRQSLTEASNASCVKLFEDMKKDLEGK